jgi:hypothetical protein
LEYSNFLIDEKKVEGKLELAHDEMQKMEKAMKNFEEGSEK